MKHSCWRTAVEEWRLQVVYICGLSIPAQTADTPDPLQASRPPRHQNAEWRKPLSGIPCRCHEIAYQNLGIVARDPRNQSAGRMWCSCPAWPSLRTDGTFLLRASPCRLIECNTFRYRLWSVREGRFSSYVLYTLFGSYHIGKARLISYAS